MQIGIRESSENDEGAGLIRLTADRQAGSCSHLGHVPARVARDGLSPLLLIERPASIELRVDLGTRLGEDILLDLRQADEPCGNKGRFMGNHELM